MAVPGQPFGEIEWDSADRLGTAAHSCVCTHKTHGDMSQRAVSDSLFTYSPLKVFGYALKLARESCMLLCERYCCIRTLPHKKIKFGSSISLLLLDSQGWGIRECWCPSEISAHERPDRWVACGQELLELSAPLLFWFSCSVKEFPATEVAVWASSSFCHYGWLEFQIKNPTNPHKCLPWLALCSLSLLVPQGGSL